jgi:hypothetical protein
MIPGISDGADARGSVPTSVRGLAENAEAVRGHADSRPGPPGRFDVHHGVTDVHRRGPSGAGLPHEMPQPGRVRLAPECGVTADDPRERRAQA